MENTFAFLSAALPWIAMALLLAIFSVRETGRKKDQEKQMGSDLSRINLSHKNKFGSFYPKGC